MNSEYNATTSNTPTMRMPMLCGDQSVLGSMTDSLNLELPESELPKKELEMKLGLLFLRSHRHEGRLASTKPEGLRVLS